MGIIKIIIYISIPYIDINLANLYGNIFLKKVKKSQNILENIIPNQNKKNI